MTSNLALIDTEKFHELDCRIYQNNGCGEYLFTREHIGMALEYENPRVSIGNIHNRHKERLDKFSIRLPIEKVGDTKLITPTSDFIIEDETFRPENGGTQETVLYTRRGIMEICRWSRQPRADEFIDFVWDVTDRLMSGELQLAPGNNSTELVAVNQQLVEMREMLHGFTERFDNLEKESKKINTQARFSNYYLRLQMRSGYDRNWESRQSELLKSISNHTGAEQRTILQTIYKEMERRYGILLNDFVHDYKVVKKISTCSVLSVVSHSYTLREMFDAVMDDVVSACGITDCRKEKQFDFMKGIMKEKVV